MHPTKLSVRRGVRQLWLTTPRNRALAAGILASACLASASVMAATDHASTFVQKSATEAIGILTNSSLADQAKRVQFRAVVLKYFDAPAIGRFVVEPYWAKAPSEQQTRFQSVFEGALAAIYTERFFDYDGQSLQVKSTHPGAAGVTVVQTTVATPTGSKTYDVDWMVSGVAGKEKFVDVVIDGISTSVTTKADYGAVLQSSNGSLDALTAALKAKAQ